MNTCANCADKATLVYNISNVQNIYYCESHAPKSLRSRLITLTTNDDLVAKVEEVKKSTKKAKTTTVINSTPVEEVVDSKSEENEPTEEEVTDNESDN